jgi:hypothetical protein
MVSLARRCASALGRAPSNRWQDRVRAQVDVRREELLDQRAQRVGLGETRDLVAELELLEDVLDVR